MKRIKVDNSKEILVLTGLIVSTKFIKEVIPILDTRLLKSKHSKFIAQWCIDFYNDNKEAPGTHIQDIFDEKVQNQEIQEEDLTAISKILDRISDEYERANEFNIDFVKKIAETYFNSQLIHTTIKKVEKLLDRDPQEASLLLQNFKPKTLQATEGYSVLKDKELIRSAFEEATVPIMKFPGELGNMINDDLYRGAFIGLMGREKIGKTWFLMEFTLRACMNRLNVALFQAGDMSDKEQALRIAIRIAKKSNKWKYCGDILVPTYDCLHNQLDTCNIKQRTCKFGIECANEEEIQKTLGDKDKKEDLFEDSLKSGYIPCDFCRRKYPRNYKGAVWYNKINVENPLTWQQAYKANLLFDKKYMKGKDFKMRSYPADTLTVDMIENQLDNWIDRDLFVPDVIVIDYADLMNPGINSEFRHQQNSIWKKMRALAHKYNCLVLTATQPDAEGLEKTTLKPKNFSEDKRKYSHVTAFYTLNGSDEEMMIGRIRFARWFVRGDMFDTRKQIKIMQCLQIGRANLGSFL